MNDDELHNALILLFQQGSDGHYSSKYSQRDYILKNTIAFTPSPKRKNYLYENQGLENTLPFRGGLSVMYPICESSVKK